MVGDISWLRARLIFLALCWRVPGASPMYSLAIRRPTITGGGCDVQISRRPYGTRHLIEDNSMPSGHRHLRDVGFLEFWGGHGTSGWFQRPFPMIVFPLLSPKRKHQCRLLHRPGCLGGNILVRRFASYDQDERSVGGVVRGKGWRRERGGGERVGGTEARVEERE